MRPIETKYLKLHYRYHTRQEKKTFKTFKISIEILIMVKKVNVKQSLYRPGVAQIVTRS